VGVGAHDVDNVVIDVGSYYVQGLTQPTTSTSYGIRASASGNGAYSRFGAVNVIGFYKGFQFYEHCNGYSTQTAWGCNQGFVFESSANHASQFQRLMAV